MDFSTVIERMKSAGIQFDKGLTDCEIDHIERLYEIKFPASLRQFYSQALPISEDEHGFPEWRDFSDANIAKIKERIDVQYKWLLHDVQRDSWLAAWGERPHTEGEITARFIEVSRSAPKLIPLYAHRYMPMLEGAENPPVISTVGIDTIYYGSDLNNYLRNEFLNKKRTFYTTKCMHIPFWSDIIES